MGMRDKTGVVLNMLFRTKASPIDNAVATEHLHTGEIGEVLAVEALKNNGYTVLKQNHRTKLGEIDIIAQQDGTLVFVEVKARRSNRFGSPKWAVNAQKQRKISQVALEYLKATDQMNRKARFDVVTVWLAREKPEVEIIENAFDLAC